MFHYFSCLPNFTDFLSKLGGIWFSEYELLEIKVFIMNEPWSSDFSNQYFGKLLTAAKTNFNLHLFADVFNDFAPNGKPSMLIRHDVDIDMIKALEMAKIEAKFGVRSTYMVMPNCLLYSFQDKDVKDALFEISSLGHEIALHFDLDSADRVSNLSVSDIESKIVADINSLEDVIHSPIHSLSFHRPLPQFLQGSLKIAGRVNAYAADLMGWYISDSAGRWRDGEPLPKLLAPQANLLQLLIHPIWWGNSHMAAEDRLEDYFNSKTEGWPSEKVDLFDIALHNQIGVRRRGIKNI